MQISRLQFARASSAATLMAFATRTVSAQTAPLTVRAAITPVYYDATAVLYAQKVGWFTKAGIDLQLGRLPTGAAITAAVAGGSLDVGKSSFSPIVSAFGHGLPITLIAPGVVYDAKSPNGALVVPKDSPIHTAADLVGKVIAVNNLTDPTRPAIDKWLEQNGQSKDAVKLVEIGMNTMPAAADEKRVDVIMLTSPIMDEAMATGKYRLIAPVMSAIAPRWLFSAFFSQKDWALKHKEAAKRFNDVIVQSAIYTNAHHVELAPLIAEMTNSNPTTIARETWPIAGTSLVPTEMQPVIDLAAQYGMIAKRFEARDMIFDPTAN